MNYKIEIRFLDGSAEVFTSSTKSEANGRISEGFRKGYFSLTQGSPGQTGRDLFIPVSSVKEIIIQVQVSKK